MKIVFFGTPEYVLPILEKLHKTYNASARDKQLIAVVTQEPKEVGREKKLTRSAVDNWAYKHKVDVIFDLNDVPHADLGIVASYGRIIPKEIIDQFSQGLLNIHPSLLPEFRGASPIQATLATGKTSTGLSIIQMDHLMDHGPIVSSFKEDILPEDTNESLRDRLFERSAQFLIDLIPHYLSGKIKLKEQDHNKATFTKLITKQDGFVPPQIIQSLTDGSEAIDSMPIGFIKDYEITPTATDIYNLYRALSPWPGLWTTVELANSELKRLKILKVHAEKNKLVLDEVHLEGKNPVSWNEFRRGYIEAKLVA